MEEYVSEVSPDVVVHTAGLVGGIHANMAHPVAYLEKNTAMGRNIVMGAYNSGVKGFLNLGSTCMYPRAADNPLTEDMILSGELEPTNEGYALAKIVALRLCEYIQREDKSVQYKTIIPCNLYGRFDKFDPKNSHVLPAIIHKLHQAKVNGSESVEIWGDGTARREFMYAGDLADAIFKAIANMNALPNVMNCGPGTDHSINHYYETVAEAISWKGTFVHDLEKPVGMKQKLSSTKLQTEWGWSPTTSLRVGLEATYEFYRNESRK